MTFGAPNLRRGLLRLWLALNVPIAVFFAYSVYVNHACALDADSARSTWSGLLRDLNDRVDAYERAVEQGLPATELRVRRPTQEEVNEARSGAIEAIETRDGCQASQRRFVTMFFAVPISSLGAVFALLWVRAGFTS